MPAVSRAVVTLALCALSVVAAQSPASAASGSASSPAVRRIDRQIQHAEWEIARWNRRLVRWQVRVSKAAAAVQQAMILPPGPLGPPAYYSTPLMANHYVPPAGDPLARAHRRLQRVLRDHRAKEAQQQSAAWQDFLGRLQGARTRAVARANHRQVVSVPSGPVTYQGWAHAFLASLGAPSCDDNVVVVVTWETAESTLAAYNPLATTYDMPRATDFNGVGVKNYLSFSQGVRASRGTLEGRPDSLGYTAIIQALRSCAPVSSSAAAIRDSAWCRGCGAGAYVLGLLPEVRASWADHAARLISTG